MSRTLIYRRFKKPDTRVPPPAGIHSMVLDHYEVAENPRVGETFLAFWERVKAGAVLVKTSKEHWEVLEA